MAVAPNGRRVSEAAPASSLLLMLPHAAATAAAAYAYVAYANAADAAAALYLPDMTLRLFL
jgi:hypothetical protein